MERQEKERVKKLTLDIQRMQLEDSLEQPQVHIFNLCIHVSNLNYYYSLQNV